MMIRIKHEGQKYIVASETYSSKELRIVLSTISKLYDKGYIEGRNAIELIEDVCGSDVDVTMEERIEEIEI